MDGIDKGLLKGYAERYREACKEFDKAKEKYIYREVKVEEADELRESYDAAASKKSALAELIADIVTKEP
ncbi:MAG: hypothetical protein MR713_01900 [Firmicutes bacterium]|nr:hypothetical protein [Bacillota bacterium]